MTVSGLKAPMCFLQMKDVGRYQNQEGAILAFISEESAKDGSSDVIRARSFRHCPFDKVQNLFGFLRIKGGFVCQRNVRGGVACKTNLRSDRFNASCWLVFNTRWTLLRFPWYHGLEHDYFRLYLPLPRTQGCLGGCFGYFPFALGTNQIGVKFKGVQ